VFSDQKLAGIILICCGFLLVLTPTHWAAMLRKIFRWGTVQVGTNFNIETTPAGGDLHKTLVASKVDLRTG
jgi:hypothetical protein